MTFRAGVVKKRSGVLYSMIRNKELLIMITPGIIYLIVFKYIPMYGALVAFKDYNPFAGFLKSEWIGLANFQQLFSSAKFPQVLLNTVLISLYKIAVRMPAPLIFALLLNEVRTLCFKKTVQTISYIPHFISWVVVAGIFTDILSPNNGIVNSIIEALGGEPVFFLADIRYFRSILVLSDVWKETGWGAIIYLAAITGIDQQLYEASFVDGAGRLRQTWHVTLPGIKSTIFVLLILKMGQVLKVGHEQVLMMYNPAVYEVGDVISTYVYRVGLGQMEFSLTAAAGLFQSVIGCILIVLSNNISRKMEQGSVW